MTYAYSLHINSRFQDMQLSKISKR